MDLVYCTSDTLFVWTSVFTSNRIMLIKPFTVLYNAIVCKTAIVSVNVIINSITQNYLIVHSIMHVIFNQLLFVTLF